jgi:quercetin dioxygenase-like cupin family protein
MMFIKNLTDVEKLEIKGEGIANVRKQVPLGPAQGWADHVVRVFTLGPGGHTPNHSHDWEHVNYVISGSGQLEIEGGKRALAKGDFAFVPPNVKHQYSNPGRGDFVMICIVPIRGES